MNAKHLPFMILLLVFQGNGRVLKGQTSALDEYIAMGLERNLDIRQQQIALEKRQVGVDRARANYWPDIDFAASYTLAQGGRRIDIPVGDLLNPAYSALNGLVEGSPFPERLENVEEQFLPNDFHDTRIRVRQPLFNTGIHYGAQIAEREVGVQVAQLATKRADIVRDITTAYYQYLQSRELIAIYDTSRVLLEELLRFNQKMVRYNKITRDAVATVESELADLASDRSEAVRQYERVKAYFNHLLYRPLDEAIKTDSIAAPPPAENVSLEMLKAQAGQQRSELDQLQQAVTISELVVQLREKDRLPQLGMELQAGFQGFSYTFDNRQSYFLLGFSLEWDIFGGNRKQYRIQEAQLERIRTQQHLEQVRQQVELQVVQAYYDWQASKAQYHARQEARKSAAESFRIIRKQYGQEQVLLVELLDARTRFTNAQIQQTIAACQMQIKHAELLRAVQQSPSF